MKKIIIYIISILAFVSCGRYNISKEYESSNLLFEVYEIDSINGYYLIYAKKEDLRYKIVSKKNHLEFCNRIETGKKYELDLVSKSSQAPTINGIKVQPVTIIDVMCYDYENDTKICTDRKNGIFDLYHAENLKGLCIIRNSTPR